MKISYIHILIFSAVLILVFFILMKKKKSKLLTENENESSQIPRGVRNNNFGNVKYRAENKWRGKVPYSENTDKVFEQFKTPEYGARAQMILIRNKFNSGLNTIDKIISEYAPPVDLQLGVKNNTAEYINYVSDFLDYDSDQNIDLNDGDMLKNMAYAMGLFENSEHPAVKFEIYKKAYDLI